MSAIEPVNILMVDDQPGKLLTYEAILADLGENLIQAKSAREALEILLHKDIGVVLMDVSMPELDGFELADMIREHPRFQKTAIMFISGVHLTESDTLNGYRRGAVDYISVPVIPEVLRAKISVFVELHRKTRLLEKLNNDLELRVEERTEELRQSEAQFRTMADSIPQLAWMADADGTGFWYNQRWCDFAGTSLARLRESGWAYLRHPDHAARVGAGIQRSIVNGLAWEDTFPLRKADGEYRWFLVCAVPILDATGQVVRWFGTATDVSEQIAAEERIRLLNSQLEQRVAELETIMQVLPVGLAISTDAQFASVTTNPSFGDIFGSQEFSFVQDRGSGNTSEQNPSPFTFMSEAIRTGRPVTNAEMRLLSPAGTHKHVLASASPLIELSGRVRGSVGVFFDATQRKRLEDALRERAELLELASEAIMVCDTQGVIRYWNSGAEAFYGWNRESAVGQNVHELLQTSYPVAREEVERILASERSWQGNLKQRTYDGRDVVVASRMALDPETNVVLEINRDITGELQAEEALRKAEKLAAMGRMAGIIAHEINNPLEAITNTFYLLRNHPSLDGEAQSYAALAEQELQRASHITRQTLSFYRESRHPIAVSLPEVLNNVIELQQRNLQAAGITLQRRYETKGSTYGFPGELRQVFLNLVDNAIHAMPTGGILRVHIQECADLAVGRRGVAVSIIDTGAGIRREDTEKLFQPFFSTKSTKGTGLGLWISKGIIQKYEGRISFRSQRHAGRNATCFRVFLPNDQAPATVSATKPALEPVSVAMSS